MQKKLAETSGVREYLLGYTAHYNSVMEKIMIQNYQPLPDYLTVSESDIHGLGLIAIKKIRSGTVIGRSHILQNDGEYLRTPIGGFGNHSEYPNCSKVEMEPGVWYIICRQDIQPDEEITWKYTLYKPQQKEMKD